MEHLNFVNLIQAGTVTIGILGALQLWQTRPQEFRGISLLLALIALAAGINIAEESGLTRDIYLVSPVFIMLFGPATFLAIKLVINKHLMRKELWHLSPALPLLLFTAHTDIVIGISTAWRLAYAALTVSLLLQHKRSLDEQRSDADDFSLSWLIWVLAITAMFNLVDLVRLNFQLVIPYQLNVAGQGINNAVWLIAAMFTILKLQIQEKIPISQPAEKESTTQSALGDYQTIYSELDSLMASNRWYLTPRLTLQALSELTGLQTREISRAINLGAKKSFNDYINDYRVDTVCRVLRSDTHKPLADIAAEAGFSSKASFNKVFKQVTGVTPTQYRTRDSV